MPGCRLHLRIVFPLLALLLIMVAACGGLRPKVSEEELSALTDEDQALVSLYLDPGGPATQKISFELAAIEIGNPDGWLPLSSKPLRVDNANRGQQQLLTLAAMPPGDYNRLRLTFSQASVDGRALSMETGGQHLELPIAGKATRNAGDHCCLFLDWHIGRTAGGVADFFSSFTTRWQSQPLSTDLVCILCDDLRTIYQARPDTGWVVAAMRLEDRFGEAAYDPSRRRMYLLGIDSRILQVIDIYTNRVEDAIPLPLTIAPRYLALAPDGHRAYISDPLGNRLVQLNLASGFVEQQQTFNYRPERIHYLETAAGDLLAVSVPEDQAIHLLNPKTLATVRTISLNGSPGSLVTTKGSLYVTDPAAGSIDVYDIQTGNLAVRIQTGRQPMELTTHAGNIYVANYGDNYLSLILPRQQHTFRRFQCGGAPIDLEISTNWQKIYVANRDARRLTVIDVHSGIQLVTVPLGGKPREIVLWEQ